MCWTVLCIIKLFFNSIAQHLVAFEINRDSFQVGDMGRKGWGSLNGQNVSPGQGGYNAPESDPYYGVGEPNTTAGEGYQQSKSSSKVSSAGGQEAAGGWADWDDDKQNGA